MQLGVPTAGTSAGKMKVIARSKVPTGVSSPLDQMNLDDVPLEAQ